MAAVRLTKSEREARIIVAKKLRQRSEQSGPTPRQATEERAQRDRRISFQDRGVVHSAEPRQLSLEVTHCAQIGVVRIQETEGAPQEMK